MGDGVRPGRRWQAEEGTARGPRATDGGREGSTGPRGREQGRGAGGREGRQRAEGKEEAGQGPLRGSGSQGAGALGAQVRWARGRRGPVGAAGPPSGGWGTGSGGGRSGAAGAGFGEGARPRPPHLGSGSRIFLLARAAGVALLFSMAIR